MSEKTQKIPEFIAKLYEILNDQSSKDIIEWNQDLFVIKNTEALVAKVLPKYYRHSKLQSFVRQLNLYGFRKVPKSTQKQFLYFKNDIFREGAPQLLHKIQLKSKEKKRVSSNGIEDVKELTKQTNQELTNIRSAFKSTVEAIYKQIKEIGHSNSGLEDLTKESLSLLRLCGVNQELINDNMEVFHQQSVTNFLTKFNFDL